MQPHTRHPASKTCQISWSWRLKEHAHTAQLRHSKCRAKRELKTAFPRVWMICKRNGFTQDRYKYIISCHIISYISFHSYISYIYICISYSCRIISFHINSYIYTIQLHCTVTFFDYHIYLDPWTLQCWINSVLDQFKSKASHHSGSSPLLHLEMDSRDASSVEPWNTNRKHK